MSKAFVRESESDDSDPVLPPVETLPPGAKNYLTPDGARRLEEELTHLRGHSRPPIAARSTDSGVKRELQRLDHRIRRLEQSLLTAEVVEPPSGNPDTVGFGAIVTVRDTSGVSDRYRIVGVDEIDSERGWISYRSPLASALLHAHPGDHVSFQTPRGPSEIEVLAVSYELEPVEN